MTEDYKTPSGAAPPDWRGLCQRMADAIDDLQDRLELELSFGKDWKQHPLAVDARTALAQPVPEVAGPSLKQVSDWITRCGQNPEENKWTKRVDHHDALAIAKAALYDWGLPAPAPAGEVAELVAALKDAANSLNQEGHGCIAQPIFRAADLLEQRQAATVPVAVSERLPGSDDCDAGDNCWWFDPHADGAWYVDIFQSCYTHWLPAHALPLPTTEPQP